MNISVIGLWHLGSVTAACLAEKGFKVTGYDSQVKVINNLNNGIPPLFEPGLEELIKKNIESKKLTFSSNPASVASADLIWLTLDTPVDEHDIANTAFVENEIVSLFPIIKDGTIVIVSSQLPVGSIAKLEKKHAELFPSKKISFACSPENLRLGRAISVFMDPDRIIVGVMNEHDQIKLSAVLTKISPNIVWMKVESAEMTKHALNAFLATSVVFINELAVLCEHVGADAREVERGLKSEMRIGEKAYLRPGSAFAGGTLARDVTYIVQKEEEFNLSSVFFSGIIQGNENHKHWVKYKLESVFGSVTGKIIGVLGLTYKPGTDTLRRSTAIEICEWLHKQKATVLAYDPAIKKLPSELEGMIKLVNSAQEVIEKANAVVIATEWPEFAKLQDNATIPEGQYIIDANAFLKGHLDKKGINYISIGQAL